MLLVKGKTKYKFCRDCARIVSVTPDINMSIKSHTVVHTECDLCEEEKYCKSYTMKE